MFLLSSSGPAEYFYRRPRINTNLDNATTQQQQQQQSSGSSMGANEAHMRTSDEFEQMIQHYQQKRPH